MTATIIRSFNSRPHEEVDPDMQAEQPRSCNFQLTTSRRGRLEASVVFPSTVLLSTHDLTKRSTLQVAISVLVIHLSTHDLTKRSTVIRVHSGYWITLSTHDLTKRSTQLSTPALIHIGLSTHDLTKRSTRRGLC